MKNYLSFLALDSRAIEAAQIDSGSINPQVRQAIINDKMMKLYRVLDGLNDPFYNRTTLLTVAADQSYSNGLPTAPGSITINTAAKTVTDRFDSGILGSGAGFYGGEILFVSQYDPSTATWTQGVLQCTSTGLTSPYNLLSGSVLNMPDAAIHYSIIKVKTLSLLTVDLSSLYYKSIRKIWDTGINGLSRIFDEYTDPVAFQRLSTNYFERKRTAYYLAGDTLYLFVGETGSPINQLQMEYRGKPILFTDSTIANMVEIPPEDNQTIIDEVTAEYMTATGKAITPSLAASLGNYQNLYSAKAVDK